MLCKQLQELLGFLSTGFSTLVAWHWCWGPFKFDQHCSVYYSILGIFYQVLSHAKCSCGWNGKLWFWGSFIGRAQASAQKQGQQGTRPKPGLKWACSLSILLCLCCLWLPPESSLYLQAQARLWRLLLGASSVHFLLQVTPELRRYLIQNGYWIPISEQWLLILL